MKRVISYCAIVFVLVLSNSCSSAIGIVNGDGPRNLAAVLAAPDVVRLSWDAVEGATGYTVELSIDKADSFQIIALPSESTSYEDLTAPEQGDLIYQVQVFTASGPAGKSQVSVTTGRRKPNPLAVIPEYDEAKAATAVIGNQGGTLSLVNSDAVEFALSIPAGALSADTEIRMTPVAAISDWPFGEGPVGAVRLEPDGLVLNDAATLTIGFPSDVKSDLAIVGFGFRGDGREFALQSAYDVQSLTSKSPSSGGHLAALAFQQPPIRRIVLPVMELKVRGVGKTFGKEAASFAIDYPPSDAGEALDQKRAAQAIADDELTPLTKIKGTGDPARKEAFEIIKGIYNASDCQELNSQIVSFQKWRQTRNYLQLSDDRRREVTSQIWEELTDKVKQVLENAANECEKSSKQGGSGGADVSCARSLLSRIANPPAGTVSSFNLDLKNKLGNKLSDKELQNVSEKLDRCQKAYAVSGSSSGVSFSGSICGLDNPFILSVAFPGGSGKQTFTPTGATGGDVTESSSGQGCEQSGGGVYSIVVNEAGAATLQWTVMATLSCPGMGESTNALNFEMPLKPIPGASCH